MKIAVVGGGSTYTPELVSGLSRERDRIGVRRARPARHRRRAARGRRRAGRADARAPGLRRRRSSVTGELDRALDGADFVLVQIRVGGQAARLSDETVPLACGCIGQETTGAGGFAKALRTVPVVLEIAERVRELASPDAWIVDFTNPVGIVTRSLLDAGHRAVGLCNVAIGFQRSFARLLGVEPERGRRRPGRPQPPDLDPRRARRRARRAAGAARRARRRASPSRRRSRCGCSRSSASCRPPTCSTSTATTRCSRSSSTARRGPRSVAEIERGLLELYRDPALNEKPALLEQRGGAFYSEAATGLVALARQRRRRRARGRRPQRRHARRARRRRRRRGAGARRARAASSRCRRRRSRPSCSASPSTSPRTSGWPRGRRSPATPRSRGRRCSRTR